MAKPVIDFNIFRRVAETASGFRYQDTWFVVRRDEQDNLLIVPEFEEPKPDPDQEVYFVAGVEYGRSPAVTTAFIGSGPTIINLLDLPVPEQQMHPAGTYQADAVFWSVSAVEKFLVPYYASVYGDQAASVVDALLNILRPYQEPAEGADNADQAFAVAHLPNSEYVTIDGELAVGRLVALRRNGTVHLVRVAPGGN